MSAAPVPVMTSSSSQRRSSNPRRQQRSPAVPAAALTSSRAGTAATANRNAQASSTQPHPTRTKEQHVSSSVSSSVLASVLIGIQCVKDPLCVIKCSEDPVFQDQVINHVCARGAKCDQSYVCSRFRRIIMCSSSHQVHRMVRVVISVRDRATSTPQGQDSSLYSVCLIVCDSRVLLNVTSGHSDRWTMEERPIFDDFRLCWLSHCHVDYVLRLPSTLGL